MPRNRYDGYIPDPTDRISVDDFFAIKFPEGAQLDNWRKQLTFIRGEVLEIAERGSQQGLVDLKREAMRLASAGKGRITKVAN